MSYCWTSLFSYFSFQFICICSFLTLLLECKYCIITFDIHFKSMVCHFFCQHFTKLDFIAKSFLNFWENTSLLGLLWWTILQITLQVLPNAFYGLFTRRKRKCFICQVSRRQPDLKSWKSDMKIFSNWDQAGCFLFDAVLRCIQDCFGGGGFQLTQSCVKYCLIMAIYRNLSWEMT